MIEDKENRETGGKKSDLYEKMTPFRNAALFVNIPLTLLSCTLVGAGIGYLIERWRPSNGIFIAIFCMMGVAAGFREIIMLLKREDKKRKRDE